jgi:hypothetical protein
MTHMEVKFKSATRPDQRAQLATTSPTRVDTVPRLGQDPQWDSWSLLWEGSGRNVVTQGVSMLMAESDERPEVEGMAVAAGKRMM